MFSNFHPVSTSGTIHLPSLSSTADFSSLSSSLTWIARTLTCQFQTMPLVSEIEQIGNGLQVLVTMKLVFRYSISLLWQFLTELAVTSLNSSLPLQWQKA